MSKVIKSQFTQTDKTEKKVIGLQPLYFNNKENDEIEAQEEEAVIDLEEFKAEAEEIIRQAQDEAKQIKAYADEEYQQVLKEIENARENWHFEKEKLIEAARQEGHELGFNQGKQEGFQEYKGLIDHATQVVEQAKQDYHKHIEDAEYSILHLSTKIAEKIMKQSLDEDPDSFLPLVRGVIKEVKEHSDVTIYVHPENYDLVLSQKDELQMLFSFPETKLYVSPDDALFVSSCVIESSFGRIDASIDTQLNEIKTKLLELLDEEKEHEHAGY